mgnify:CR=1 FL=1
MNDTENKKEIKIISFEEMMDNLYPEKGGDNYSIHGVFKYDPELGDFIDNTLIPSIYNRYVIGQQGYISTDKSKLYYPHGKDNKFPLFLLDLQSKSHTLEAALDVTAKSARGKGLTVVCKNEKVRQTLVSWLKRVGVDAKCERKFFQNLAATRGVYVELGFSSRVEEEGVKADLQSINPVNFVKYRVGVENEQGETDFYWYHPNFYSQRVDSRRLRGVKAYTNAKDVLSRYLESTVVKSDKETPFYEDEQKPFNIGKFVYHVADVTLKSEHYPLPSYSTESTINAIMTEAAISMLDMSSIENGLTTAYFVTVPLIKPREDNDEAMQQYEDTKKEYLNYIKDTFQGAENAENFVVLFADPRRSHEPIHIAEVPHNNTSDVLQGKASRKDKTILTAFRITHPALIGNPPESGKGFNNQSGIIGEADDQFYTDFVWDLRLLAEEFFNDIVLEIFREVHAIYDEEVKIEFPRKRRYNTMPSDRMLLAVVPTSKIWELYGLGEYTEEARKLLIRDLIDRQIAKAPAVPLGNDSGSEDHKADPEDEDRSSRHLNGKIHA